MAMWVLAFSRNADSSERTSLPLVFRLKIGIKLGNLRGPFFAEIGFVFADGGVAPETTFRIPPLPLLQVAVKVIDE